jgi:hypothetical protein
MFAADVYRQHAREYQETAKGLVARGHKRQARLFFRLAGIALDGATRLEILEERHRRSEA